MCGIEGVTCRCYLLVVCTMGRRYCTILTVTGETMISTAIFMQNTVTMIVKSASVGIVPAKAITVNRMVSIAFPASELVMRRLHRFSPLSLFRSRSRT